MKTQRDLGTTAKEFRENIKEFAFPLHVWLAHDDANSKNFAQQRTREC